MPRRSAASRLAATFPRAAQRNLQSLARSTLRSSQKVAKQVQRAVVEHQHQQYQPPPGPGDWLAGTAIGPAGAKNAALLAMQILGIEDKELQQKIVDYRKEMHDQAKESSADLVY